MDIFPSSAAVCGIEITYCPRMRGSSASSVERVRSNRSEKRAAWRQRPILGGFARGTWDVGRGDSRDESRPEAKKGETAASRQVI